MKDQLNRNLDHINGLIKLVVEKNIKQVKVTSTICWTLDVASYSQTVQKLKSKNNIFQAKYPLSYFNHESTMSFRTCGTGKFGLKFRDVYENPLEIIPESFQNLKSLLHNHQLNAYYAARSFR